MLGAQAGRQTVAQEAIPDAPKPKVTLPDLRSVTPGQGTSSSDGAETPAPAPSSGTPTTVFSAGTAGASAPPAQSSPTTPGVDVPSGKGEEAIQTLLIHVDAVDVPFTVKDSKGHLVPGLTGRDVQVYENGILQRADIFTADALPLSVVVVIDQSMTQEQMDKVNTALGALQDAFTRYDEIAVFTYNKVPKQITTFTGAQSARATQAIERSKGQGRDALTAGSLSGPLAQTTVLNDYNVDPNTAAVRGHTGMQLDVPREIHPLNDAIMAAATVLSNRQLGRRRVIYVISNGNEYGSTAKTSEVIKYLQRNSIEVDGTLVGDTAIPVLGFLDRIHLPLTMRDNVLITYQRETAGQLDSEIRLGSIEKSFSRIAEEVRTRYTIGYTSHEPFVDGKYRKWEVKVLKPDLTVMAPRGYYPSAIMERQQRATQPAQ
jgi:VWFA-related protein